MRTFSHIAAATAAGALAFVGSGFVHIAHAETRLGGTVSGDLHLMLKDSPYILTGDVNILAGHTLAVDPGVSIDADPATPNASINVDGGTLNMGGTADARIRVGRIGHIFINNGTANVSYADLATIGLDLQLYGSVATVRNSTVTGSSGTAIYSLNSSITINDSRIADNAFAGLYVLAGASPISVNVHNSIFTGNGAYALLNRNSATVRAENNWWGTSTGPVTAGANKVAGPVATAPWLTTLPALALEPPPCCSSILFIPGLEGTRLFESISWPLVFGETAYKDWEPAWGADVRKLYLDQNGSSTNPSVYSGQPIDTAFGFTDIYGGFMDFLDSLVARDSIREWKAFGYDWRKPVPEVVAGLERKATTTESLVERVLRMASSSKTGKVSIVAHSNGGLVAKYLVKTLGEMGLSGTIDLLISVAVPYLGTPEAVAGLLHGDHQSIAYGLITSQGVARGLGENMASAYSLLPSASYFSGVFSPTIAFASTTVVGLNDGSYPREIRSAAGQAAFVTDSNNARGVPSFADTNAPIKGNKLLMGAAELLHGILDPFSWPTSIIRYAIAGFNADTTSGVLYASRPVCLIGYIGLPCYLSPTHVLVRTSDGDGTVVTRSALYEAGTSTLLDLRHISADEGRTVRHATILEASATQSLIKDIITTRSVPSALPPGVVGEAVPVAGEPISFVIRTHSPVELHAHDGLGNHTGLMPKPASVGGNDFITGAYEEQIPGSSFEISDGPDGYDTTIRLPAGNKDYSIEIEGLDLGFAMLDIEKTQGATVLNSTEYSMLPVTPFTVATTSTGDPALLSIDTNGDGTAEQVLSPNPGALPAPGDGLKTIKSLVRILSGSDPHTRQLMERIDHLADLLEKGKLKQAEKQGASFTLNLGHLQLKTISPANRQKILDAVERLLGSVESAQ